MFQILAACGGEIKDIERRMLQELEVFNCKSERVKELQK